MFIGKVTGTVVSPQKVPPLIGSKLLLVQAYNIKGDSPATLVQTPRTAVAVDNLGAGEGEFVLVTQGSSARLTESTKNLPVDAVVVGIIDTIQVGPGKIELQES
jgi:ethanolamine utilization protein EutN